MKVGNTGGGGFLRLVTLRMAPPDPLWKKVEKQWMGSNREIFPLGELSRNRVVFLPGKSDTGSQQNGSGEDLYGYETDPSVVHV